MDVSGKTEPLCPRCKTRPRRRAESGTLGPYCSECAVTYDRERKGYTAAERACTSCTRPYRGNSRAKAQLCPDCRAASCVTCGRPKTPGDKAHSECQACRSASKICSTCGVNPTHQNYRKCWDCLSTNGEGARRRDRLYNLPPGWFDQKLAAQGGVCEISGCPETSVNKRTGKTLPLAIDHDHSCCPGVGSCGKCLRGLIRRNLNVALGMFGDDPDLLEAAAAYIRQYRTAA